MARTLNQIINSMIVDIQADSTLSTQVTSTSSVALWRLWVYIVANAIYTEELANDTFLASAESAISSNPPANTEWVKRYVSAFQYSVSNPQVVQIGTVSTATNFLIPSFPTIDDTLKIITRSSIVSPYISNSGALVGTAGVVLVKVAKGSNPQALSIAELSAFQNYLNIIKPAGVVYKAQSVSPDLLFCQVMIYYIGSYAGVIQTNVYNAYIGYLNNIPFDGLFKISDLEVILRGVEGVTDLIFVNVSYRRDATAFTPGSYNIIQNYLQIRRDSADLNLAGYVIDETQSGYDFLTINAGNYISS